MKPSNVFILGLVVGILFTLVMVTLFVVSRGTPSVPSPVPTERVTQDQYYIDVECKNISTYDSGKGTNFDVVFDWTDKDNSLSHNTHLRIQNFVDCQFKTGQWYRLTLTPLK